MFHYQYIQSEAIDISSHPCRHFFQTVPNGEKWESTEKAKGSSELGQKGGERIEEHLVVILSGMWKRKRNTSYDQYDFDGDHQEDE